MCHTTPEANNKNSSRFFTVLFFGIIAAVSAVSFISCSGAKPFPKFAKEKPPAPSSSLALPDGWSDITTKSRLPQILLWIVNQNFSGTMELREMQMDDSTRNILLKEDPCFVANISLRAKLADENNGKRITRVPAMIDAEKEICGYTFTENALLRRVIVYRKQKKFYELELLQENASSAFEDLTNDQLSLVNILIAR
ncbi:MAG: hypothetical protein PHP42_11635 [Bacteroidota bacterium]|nr:hypothetical protein [Bacteroidota bacterium]